MIYSVKGTLIHIESGFVVVECNGIGFRVNTTLTTQRNVKLNSTVTLYTHMSVREDAMELYGFYSKGELSTFKMLISISGVGPKVALAVLSLLTPEKFALAVCGGDQKAISKANGVGAKTAARIILELKDKLMKVTFASTEASEANAAKTSKTVSSDTNKQKISDAHDALTVLGYNRIQINSVLSTIDISSLSLEEIIKAALKKLV